MRAVGVVGIVATTGCFHTNLRPSCEEHAVDVADDEQTPEGTAEELLALAVGEETVDGLLAPDDDVVPVTWTVEHRPGSAQWVESEPITEVLGREFGIGSTTLTIAVTCDDRLEVPITLAMNTAGGEVDVDVDTVVVSFPSELSSGVLHMLGFGPYAEAEFPALPDANPDEFTGKEAFVQLTGVGGEEVSGRAGWEGSRTENSRSANTVIAFPVEPSTE